MTEEDQIAGGRERAGHVRIVKLVDHLRFSGRRIDGLEAAVEATTCVKLIVGCCGPEPVSPKTRPVSRRSRSQISDIEKSSSRDLPRDLRSSVRNARQSSPETALYAANPSEMCL